MPGPLALTPTQSLALAGAVMRELGGGLRAVSHEVRRWRSRAQAIPDPQLRADALHALDCKRGHTDGAALFWTLPRHRDRRLLRALVTYELIQDYVDSASERAAAIGDASPLFLAAVDAIEPERPLSDHYRGHPWREDGGYLRALVEAFRADSTRLPSFAVVHEQLRRDARHARVLAVNHIADPARRDAALRAWAERELPGERELRWYELSAAASGWIGTHALLALAAEPDVSRDRVEETYAAYFPWCSLSLTMLDSYADMADDARSGDHSYFGHYRDPGEGVERLCSSLERCAEAVLRLPRGERHGVIVACMAALYLSKDDARTSAMRPATRQLARAGGTLPRALVPVLRIWRVCNSQRATT